VKPWLAVVGIGEDGIAGLTPAARALIETAEVLVGGARHLGMVPDRGAERILWERPLSLTIDAIAARRGGRVTVLASGDPMWYGVGVTLSRRFPREEMTILPQPSAFSLAASRLGWSCRPSADRPISSAAGPQVHDFWEEVYIVEGALHDLTLDQTFGQGSYACRPPGMPHGPWVAPRGCLTFEVRYASGSDASTGTS